MENDHHFCPNTCLIRQDLINRVGIDIPNPFITMFIQSVSKSCVQLSYIYVHVRVT